MEASNRRYVEIISQAIQFVIPVFQRNYSWTEEQCQQLYNDVERIGQSKSDEDSTHFFGPIVYSPTQRVGAAFSRWLVIDGQQRLTTVSLFMMAIRDLLTAKKNEKDKNEAKKIEGVYLVNTLFSGDEYRKLILREHDDKTLERILNDESEFDDYEDISSAIFQNYQFFWNKIRSLKKEDIEVLQIGLGRLAVVDISLETGKDHPQQIFESLNSTGLELTQSDLVRNYLLMDLMEDDQTRLYNTHWRFIESLFRGAESHFDNFLGDFVALATRAQKQIKQHFVYKAFREEFRLTTDTSDREDLLLRIKKLARYYASFVRDTDIFPKLKPKLKRIRSFSITPGILIMRLLEAYEDDLLKEQEVERALSLLESYLMRREICGLPANSYWQKFSQISYQVEVNETLRYFMFRLFELRDTYRFPTNAEFRTALKNENIYSRRNKRILLEQLENYDSKEILDTSNCTIEHVMPQNRDLNNAWRQMLGRNWKDIQEIWVDRLGNLTLTAYNQKYSDRSFIDKKTMEDGLSSSPIRLNKYIAKHNQWTDHEINKRGNYLSNKALSIWCYFEDDEVETFNSLLIKSELEEYRNFPGSYDEFKNNLDERTLGNFNSLRDVLLLEEMSFIEVFYDRSVVYYNDVTADCVCEVLPRAGYLILLLRTKYDDCVDCDIEIWDGGGYYFRSARYDAGAFVYINSYDDTNDLTEVIKQASRESVD